MVYHFLTGSYAAPEDVGVCRFSFDPAQGFSLQKGWENFINPSFLLKHPQHPVLYTVEETTPEGTVRAWELQGALLRPLGALPTGGGSPCHLALSQDGMQLYVSNYVSGSLAVFALDESGAIRARTDVVRHMGRGPNAQRQEAAHVHFSMAFEGRVYVCDLGMDAIVIYRNEDGRLRQVGRVSMPAGSGPRHLARSLLRPDRLYCVAELDSRVYALNRETGGWRRAQSVSTLPEGFAGDNTAAAIHLTPAGTLLLASNRGHDSIAVFPVQSDGTLGRPVISRCVAQPRDFLICGDHVLAASQRDSVVRAYRLDRRTLRLEATDMCLETGRPVCLCALNQ